MKPRYFIRRRRTAKGFTWCLWTRGNASPVRFASWQECIEFVGVLEGTAQPVIAAIEAGGDTWGA